MGLTCFKRNSKIILLLFPILFMFFVYINSQSRFSNISTNQSWLETAGIETLPKFNLMEESYGSNWAKESKWTEKMPTLCTIEYANRYRLQQDHPCVIRLIRDNYLRQPAPKTLPYKMDHPKIADPSDGIAIEIVPILQYQTNGFFIECGALDGEFLSNTLYMERSLDWSGLLIEADKKAFNQLAARNRKAFISPACLSTRPYPMEVVYNGTVRTLGAIAEGKITGKHPESNDIRSHEDNKSGFVEDTENVYKMQCFPLYSILLAVGRTHVDYFGLDVEGSEYKILKTIPWHKVNIKTVTAEWDHVPEGEQELTRLMESKKFTKLGLINTSYATNEVIYVQDSFNVYRAK